MTSKQAADLLKAYFKNFEAASLLIETLENIGSLENATAERTAALTELDAQVATLRTQVEGSQRDLADARSAAGVSTRNAKAKAEQIISEAEDAARASRAEAEAAVAAAQGELAAVRDDLAAKRAALVAAEAELADVQQKIADALAAARAQLGQ